MTWEKGVGSLTRVFSIGQDVYLERAKSTTSLSESAAVKQ